MWPSASEWRPYAAFLVLLMSGCASGRLAGDGGQAYLLGDHPVALPVRSLQERKFLAVRRQEFDFSCGSAALASLLTFHYADPQSERSVFLGMWRDGNQAQIRRLGFSLLDMKRYLQGRGIASEGYEVSLEQIEKASTPGIALIDVEGYKHFVVVKGIDARSVLVGDPALGQRRIPRAEFERQWNGVLFVAMPPASRAPVFAAASDWQLAPSAIPAALPPAPLSTQALALTRPLPGDF